MHPFWVRINSFYRVPVVFNHRLLSRSLSGCIAGDYIWCPPRFDGCESPGYDAAQQRIFGSMPEPANPAHGSSPFYTALERALKSRGKTIEDICPPDDQIARRVLHDYGAMFVAHEAITPPPRCVFVDEDAVSRFQKASGRATATIDGAVIELQPAAMTALLWARAAARDKGLDITPRDGAEAARRSYADTVRLWNSRFFPALDHWIRAGRLTQPQTETLRVLQVNEQVSAVLELERDGIFFSKDFSKSVLYSIAAPGTSQHIAMLAFDANEFLDARVRELLALHGWFQTVLSDLPHFTFLGLKEAELPERGLKRVEVNGQTFWIPDVA
jgi:hypothetical protein